MMTASFADQVLEEFSELAEQEHLLPIRVTPRYRRLVEEEVQVLQGTFGPLYKVAYPTHERIKVRAPGEVKDFVRDRNNMPPGLEGIAIRKYRDRVLFLATEECAGHCMYCFRQDVLVDQHEHPSLAFDIRLCYLIEYLQSLPEAQEVIFSGGDPLQMPADLLETALHRIRSETSVTDIRVHTRSIVYTPKVFTENICRLLGDYDVRLVLHVVHPYELDEEICHAIRRIRSYGVRCYSQFPILRGINDHVVVLEKLLRQLDTLEERQLNYSASFRIPLARLFSILDELNWHTPSWINAVRLVLDTPIGKVRREDIVHWDRECNLVTFERDGEQIVYPDLPQELDVPGRISTLLWRPLVEKRETAESAKLPVEEMLDLTKS
jgi:KamA family protein